MQGKLWAHIKMIKLGFSGAMKMANEERELSVSAQCKLGGWDSLTGDFLKIRK